MSEWKKYKLGELVQTNKKSIDSNYPFEEIEYLDTGSITRGKIESFQKYKLSEAPSRAKRLVVQDDIIYSTVRPIQRHYGFIDNPLSNLVVSTGFATITCEKDKLNPKFLYYLLSNDDTVEYLDVIAEASTSAYPSLRPSDIENLEITIPELPEQKAIASILSCLDDKIDLLHRQNATLEKMAETLFRQWFIEDAKEREKTKIGLVLETVLGGTPSTNNPEYWDGTIPWINSGEVNNFRILKPTKFITELALVESNTKLLPIGTTVLAITGATLGQISLLEISTCTNQSVVGIIPNEIYPKEYVFLWIKYMIDEIILNETGGAQPHINKNDVNETEILIPCNDDLEFIESKIKPLFKKISINSFQVNTLAELRDSLLPRLMSGEITVNQG